MGVISYKQLIANIDDFASKHQQIQRFRAEFEEQMPNFATETEAYPILFMSPVGSQFASNEDTYTVRFYCFDIIQKDRANINTILSDTNLILNDLKKWFQDGYNYSFDIVGDPTATPINNALLDYAAGWTMDVTFNVDTYCFSEIPFIESPLIPTEGYDVIYSRFLTCETVTQCESLQQYIQDHILPDTTITGGTYDNGSGVATFTNSTGGTFSVSGFFTSSSDTYVDGGTYDSQTGIITFTNSQGGTFEVTGIQSGSFDNLPYWVSGSTGNYSLKAKNDSTIDATADYAYAEGYSTRADGYASHAEGEKSLASSNGAHAEGSQTTALGQSSHSEGSGTVAGGVAAHAEGSNTNAGGDYSHAGGDSTNARGIASFVHGVNSAAMGNSTIVLGNDTIGTDDNTVYVPNIQFNTGNTATLSVGRLQWNDTDGTLDLRMKGNNVTLQLGQEELIRVVNKTGGDLLESQYKAVYISGAQGNRLKVGLAIGDGSINNKATIGIVTENILNNQEGFITSFGVVHNINTTGALQGQTWNDGDTLYLSSTVAGGLTNVMPTAPNAKTIIGYVVRAHVTQGQIFVRVSVSDSLNDISNVSISSPLNSQVLSYNSTTSAWTNTTLVDRYVTGGTYNQSTGIASFTNNAGSTFNVSGFYTGYTAPTDVRVTGGTYSNTTGIATYTNNTGGTFNVSGFFKPSDDIYVTGGTYNGDTFVMTLNRSNNTSVNITGISGVFVTGGTYNTSTGIATFTNNKNGSFTVTGFYTNTNDIRVTGGTYNSSTGIATFTNNTGGTFTVSGFNSGSSFNGGTVTGATIFTGGLSANSISATTYYNLPQDIDVTGGTYNNSTGTVTFTNSTGGTFSVSGFHTGNTYSAPIVLSGQNISITQATTSTDGYVSSTDWNTFNNKGYVLAGNFNGGTIGLGVTTYIGFGVGTASTNEPQRRTVVSKGTVTYMSLRTTAAMTGNMVITAMKNGVATSMTFTIAAGSAAALYSTTANQFTVVDGDEISIRIAQTTAASAGIVGYNMIVK